jgi:hypothetical protein
MSVLEDQPYVAAVDFAQRAFCAAEIAARAFADIVPASDDRCPAFAHERTMDVTSVRRLFAHLRTWFTRSFL